MILLFDIGNTNTHLGLAATPGAWSNRPTFLPAPVFDNTALGLLANFTGRARFSGAGGCSVVPHATPFVCEVVKHIWCLRCLELTPKTLCGRRHRLSPPGNDRPRTRLA